MLVAQVANSELDRRSTGCHVLVVEDNVFAAKSLRIALNLMGHQVEIAYDGNSAIESLLHKKPDVVLVDIGLPGIDGFEVARRIRLMPGLKEILVIAVTAYGSRADCHRSEYVGIDHHLVKPVEIAVLEELIAGRKTADRS